MALPDRPTNPVIDPTSPYVGNIAHLVNVVEPSGGMMAAMVGPDVEVEGDQGTDWSILADVLGGVGLRQLTTLSWLRALPVVGNQDRDEGTLVLVFRRQSTEQGVWYSSGVPINNNNAVLGQMWTFGPEVLHQDPSGAASITILQAVPVNEWFVIILTWKKGVRRTLYMDFGTGKFAASNVDSWTGTFRVEDAARETFFGGVDSIEPWDCLWVLRLDAVLEAGDEDLFLANPFLNLTEMMVGDETPPTIVIEAPPDQHETFHSSVLVQGTVEDTETPIKFPDGVEVRVDGGDWENVDQLLLSLPSGFKSGLWSHTVSLEIGENLVEVRGTDAADNVSVPVDITVVRLADVTAPIVTIDSPEDQTETVAESVLVVGTVEDEHHQIKDPGGVEVQVRSEGWENADELVLVEPELREGTWSHTVALEVGENLIEARGTDVSENVSEPVSITVWRVEPETLQDGANWQIGIQTGLFNRLNVEV